MDHTTTPVTGPAQVYDARQPAGPPHPALDSELARDRSDLYGPDRAQHEPGNNPVIAERVTMLLGALDGLHRRIDELGQIFEPALKPGIDKMATPSRELPPSGSRLGDVLGTILGRIGAAEDRLAELGFRSEL